MCSNLNPTINIDEVAKICHENFKKVPKSGKPAANEWTVLSCILVYIKSQGKMHVVSQGTGTKCIGASKMSPKGDILNDSHAEAMARRGFLLYLYENIENALENQDSIFQNESDLLKVKDDIDFVFYSSHLPCGDAAIVPNDNRPLNEGLVSDQLCEFDVTPAKKIKLDPDIYRTGAKCLPDCEQDPHGPGADYHIIGQVRTKPGRGNRTLSVSCTDKLAKWIHVGIQGSLITLLCEPIYLKHFVFGGGIPYSQESIQRAFFNRNGTILESPVMTNFYQSTISFEHLKSEVKCRPSPASIVWIRLRAPLSEVAVQGKKLGGTKSKANSINSALLICKYHLYKRFTQVLLKNPNLSKTLLKDKNINSIPYNEMKKKATKYYENWSKVKETFFNKWTTKPDMWNFCIGN